MNAWINFNRRKRKVKQSFNINHIFVNIYRWKDYIRNVVFFFFVPLSCTHSNSDKNRSNWIELNYRRSVDFDAAAVAKIYDVCTNFKCTTEFSWCSQERNDTNWAVVGFRVFFCALFQVPRRTCRPKKKNCKTLTVLILQSIKNVLFLLCVTPQHHKWHCEVHGEFSSCHSSDFL